MAELRDSDGANQGVNATARWSAYDGISARIIGFFYARLFRQDIAEDLAQQVFIKLYRARSRGNHALLCAPSCIGSLIMP